MTISLRLVLALGLAFAVVPAAWTDSGKSCPGHKTACCAKSACGSHDNACGHKTCCGEATDWANPETVHWVHKRVSFGNYLKPGEVQAVAPMPAPSFGPLYFQGKKTELRPESVEACRGLAEYLKVNPSVSVRLVGDARRTEYVKRFLTENGVAADRIRVAGSPQSGELAVQCTDMPK